MKRLAIMALMGLAACSPAPATDTERCSFEPRRDITAYELALFVEYALKHRGHILEDHPELKRHARCDEAP